MRLLDLTLLSASPMAIDVTDAGVFCTALWSCMRLVTKMRIWKVGVEKKSFSSHPKKAKTGKDQGKRFFLCVFFNDDSFGLLIFVQKTHRRQRWHMGYRVKKFQSTRPKTNIAPENSLCRIYFLYSDLVFSERLFVYISWTMFFFFRFDEGIFFSKDAIMDLDVLVTSTSPNEAIQFKHPIELHVSIQPLWRNIPLSKCLITMVLVFVRQVGQRFPFQIT